MLLAATMGRLLSPLCSCMMCLRPGVRMLDHGQSASLKGEQCVMSVRSLVCRLYERFLDWDATNCQAWCKWAELERSLGETERVRALFELAIQQPQLDMPELLWKVGCTLWLLQWHHYRLYQAA